jgi:hypothetical protein
VIRPREIDEIRDAASRSTMSELMQSAHSHKEVKVYEDLASSFATENDQLRAERASLRSQVQQLQNEVAKLEADREALLSHLRAAKAAPAEPEDLALTDGIAPVIDKDVVIDGPTHDENRFYKKNYARPTHDVMVQVKDCGCNNWQNAHAADKARKGISKLEKGRSDWKNILHCASCTGGGMWKVRW